MFRRLLVANRGEVAARVARSCRALGVQVVAVASSADRDARWLGEAHEVVELGGARAVASYLDQDALLEVARRTGCAAVHPGWGFLAENATFAARVESAGLTFVGPPAAVIRRMGDKLEARRAAGALGLPLVPGSADVLGSLMEAREVAERVGYPVMLKAAAGGGGRGMRRVTSADGMEAAWEGCRGEAASAFGDDRLYLERLVTGGRHIELQVLADRYGRVWVLGERECSVQRRHQKLLEESPSPVLDAAVREDISRRLERFAAGLPYVGAGTVEMLRTADGGLCFMEMNTRLQVEHPVTEERFGLDLVTWQLRIAAGEALPPSVPSPRGHAVEARINAEDPAAGFRPCPGRIHRLVLPTGDGVRVDTHLREGDAVPPQYDSMVCKVIAWAPTRDAALSRLEQALAGLVVEGVVTTAPLHLALIRRPELRSGDYDTDTLDRILPELVSAWPA